MLGDGAVDPEYISSGLALPSMRQSILRMTRTTAGNYNISIDLLGRIRIPLPEPSLQQRFSAIIAQMRKTSRSAENGAQASMDLCGALMHGLLANSRWHA